MSCITVYNKLQELAQYQSESWEDGIVVTIGRDEVTHFPLPNIAALSRHHLSIRKLGGDFYIRDEQSRNGTTANGVPMPHALRMHAGVAYQAGPLTIYLEDAPASTPNPEENADSVFPEPYGFALLEPTAPAEAEQVYEQTEQVYAEPEQVYEEDDCMDLAQMAALKKAQAQQAQQAYAQPVQVYEQVEQAYAPQAEQSYAAEAVAVTPEPSVQKHITPLADGAVRPFLPIAGIPKSGIPQDFQLEIATPDGSNQIVEGEALQLLVRATEKCKVILLCQEEDGTKTMLYPNKFQTSIDIPANTWVALPEEGAYNYELCIEGAGCIDTIQAIARKSTKSVVKRGATTPPRDAKARAQATKEAKARQPQAQWAYAHLQLEVVAP